MAELQNVSLGYIADAGLAFDAAHTLLYSEEPFDEQAARQVLEELTRAVDNLVTWGRQVNRALTLVSGVNVDDHPTD